MLKFTFLKYFFSALIIFLLVSCLPHIKLEHIPSPKKDTLGKGVIVLGAINDLREKDSGGENNFNLLGRLRGGFGNPIRFYAQEGYGINIALNKLLKDALLVAGYEVKPSGSGEKIPVLDADVLYFWCDGYMGYRIASVIRLKLFSFDKRAVLLEKDLKNEHTFLIVATYDALRKGYPILMNQILKDAGDLFKSEEFAKAYELSQKK